MKYLKMLGLAAVAAVALMAIVGVGTASATVLCQTTTTPCSSHWATGTQLEFHVKAGTEGVWADTSGEPAVRCVEGILKGTPSAGGALETVTMPINGESEFNWNKGCGGIETKTLEGGKLEIHAISGTDNGTVTATGFRFTTTFLGASCIYGFPEARDLGVLTGSATGDAVLDISSVFTKIEGSFVCPLTVTWKEEFTQTGPSGTALYVEPS